METLNRSDNCADHLGTCNAALSGILGVVTLVTFGTERYLTATAGQSLGNIPAIVMGFVAFSVGVGTFYSSMQGNNLRPCLDARNNASQRFLN